MNRDSLVPYEEDYIEACFMAWYKNGCPPIIKFVESDLCPKDKWDRRPTRILMGDWINERGWRERRDALDAQVATQIDDELVALKVNMLRKQAAQAGEVRQKAFEYIIENGFDSSASAISAFIKASETERVTLGISKTIQKLSEMDDEEVMETVKELAARAESTIVDVAEVPEEEDAEPLN